MLRTVCGRLGRGERTAELTVSPLLELSGGWRVVSSNGVTLAWVYSADGIARSADPLKLTHAEAKAMAKAIAKLGR